MLLLSMTGETLPLGDPWRVFELLPAYIISVRAALNRVLGQQPANWAVALPLLFGNSDVAKMIAFDLGPDPFFISTVAGRKLPEAIKADAESFVKKGGAVVGIDKSPSADLSHVQRLVGGKGYGVVEWQQKFLLKSKLQMATVRDEVFKCVKDHPALLVIFAASVGQELREVIDTADNRVLVLSSWDEKTAAEFAFGSAKSSVAAAEQEPLACKSTMAAATAERKSVLLWQPHMQGRIESRWFVFPDQVTVTLQEPGKGAHVIVRAGLEVVIPHHDVVREFVGAKDFDALAELAVGRNPDATSAVVTCLNDFLGGRHLAPDRARASVNKDKHERLLEKVETLTKLRDLGMYTQDQYERYMHEAAETHATYLKLLNEEVEVLEKKKYDRGLTQRDEDYLTELYKKQDVLRKKFASQD
jgi:hypothetical protein